MLAKDGIIGFTLMIIALPVLLTVVSVMLVVWERPRLVPVLKPLVESRP